MKRTPLLSRRRPERPLEPGYKAWHTPVFGRCEACGKPGLLLRHHVVLEQHVRAAGGDPYDLRNAMALGYYSCACHRHHHHAVRRLSIRAVPDEAVAFCSELLGPAAGAYLSRYYGP